MKATVLVEIFIKKSVLMLWMMLVFLFNSPDGLADQSAEFDRFGGLNSVSFESTGFFRTHNDGERWWLVTPEGHAFLSMGVNCVHANGDTDRSTGKNPYRENVLAKFGSVEGWIESTQQRFQDWGINTLGAWSGNEMRHLVPYVVQLGMAPSSWGSRQATEVPDFFTPAFAETVGHVAAELDQYVDDPMVIGYFLDNELPWATDYRLGPNIFTSYVAMTADAPGKQALVNFFEERYVAPDKFSEVWDCTIQDWSDLLNVNRLRPHLHRKARKDREDFTLLVARRYFRMTTEAVHAADPNHLILGCRFIWQTVPQAAVRACGEYCDVISINFYESGLLARPILSLMPRLIPCMPNDPYHFREFNTLTGKPVMITEFSFRANDSGLPNTYPPGLIVQPNLATQADRGRKYEAYVASWAKEPYFVGWHWFQLMDQPKAGRGDGENGNFGLVNINDAPYLDLTNLVGNTNRRAWRLHDLKQE